MGLLRTAQNKNHKIPLCAPCQGCTSRILLGNPRLGLGSRGIQRGIWGFPGLLLPHSWRVWGARTAPALPFVPSSDPSQCQGSQRLGLINSSLINIDLLGCRGGESREWSWARTALTGDSCHCCPQIPIPILSPNQILSHCCPQSQLQFPLVSPTPIPLLSPNPVPTPILSPT